MTLRRIALLLCAVTSTARAQSAFVQVLRGDTVAVEKYTRTPTRLDVTLVAKGAGLQLLSSRIGPGGALGAMTLAVQAPGASAESPSILRVQVEMQADTAIAVVERGGAPQTQRIPSKVGAQPAAANVVAYIETMLIAARRTRQATATVATLSLVNGATTNAVFTNLQSDSVTVTVGGSAAFLITDSTGRVKRGGDVSGALVFSRVDGVAVTKLAFAKPDYAAPSGAPYIAESVTVPTTVGHTLGGTFTRPTGVTTRLPVVISISGSGPQDRDEYISLVPKGYRLFRQVADTLGRRGVAMLRLDDRGVGESTGSFATATSRDFASDVRAAMAYLRTRADVDPLRIFLVGHSEGGMIAPLVALDEPTLAGIVLMAGPGRSGRDILRFQSSYAIEHDTAMTPTKRAEMLARVPQMVDSALASTPWLTFFGAHDPIATAKRVKVPVLILQGGDDQQVIASEAPLLERAFRDGGNRDVTVRVFPELNHFFIRQPGGDPSGYSTLGTNLAAPEVLGLAAEWIVRKASRSGAP
ncbi:MAG: alpha/beta fold hydrolase [Gemmatimonadota bacterium]